MDQDRITNLLEMNKNEVSLWNEIYHGHLSHDYLIDLFIRSCVSPENLREGLAESIVMTCHPDSLDSRIVYLVRKYGQEDTLDSEEGWSELVLHDFARSFNTLINGMTKEQAEAFIHLYDTKQELAVVENLALVFELDDGGHGLPR